MKSERASIEILFNDISPNHVIQYLLNKYNFKPLIDFDTFYRFGIDKFSKNSSDEIEKLYIGLKNKGIDFDNVSSFFDFLGSFTYTLLVYNEYEPKIQFSKLMRWNKISHVLGQDLLTMSFLAYHDVHYYDWTDFFGYKAIISTDNRQLKNILKRGIAENHFHLKGSTQIFCLNWVSLMNYPENRNREFKYFSLKLNPYKKYNSVKELSFYDMIRLASVLRGYFFIKANNYHLEKNNKKRRLENLITLEDLENCIVNSNVIKNVARKIIDLKSKLGFREDINLDYALLGYVHRSNFVQKNQNEENPLIGERQLLYLIIRMILIGKLSKRESIYFYLYLLIKNNFRREIIQVNSIYGFSNFSDYEKRKEIFIDKFPKYKNMLIKMAIRDTFEEQNIISLEARITPKNSSKENIKNIKYLDGLCKEYTNKMFYVIHFVKKKEVLQEYVYRCRNSYIRREIEYQSKCLARSLETSNYFRQRVKGIDACNNEFFCRPEVFGQCFRFLSQFHVNKTGLKEQIPIEIFKTFHVGEDFLDITDGLRAIDEAILFCNLNNGSRLGHATVLGIDVDAYYQNKDRIIMTKQDFIDNIFWLFGKAEELNVNLKDFPCCNKLKSVCYRVFNEVYGDISNGIDSIQYFSSWKIRGDNPERYTRQGTIKEKIITNKYDFFELNTWVRDGNRTKEAIRLFYAYHYNPYVKKCSKEMFDFKIVSDYVKLVKEIQMKMRFEIARKGIFIECNPTSNYLIAGLKRYENHPIITFYNDELINGNDKSCAQINVSINTDDQGVFDTSLENEYALMAYALENSRDRNGLLYTPNKVYKWIDRVRKMGIEQKFK